MFAVVEIGGSQYRVQPKDVIQVEKLEGEPGTTVKFTTVLLYAPSDTEATIGQPYVANAVVEAKIVEHTKGDKITVVKFIPKKRYQRVRGHRQPYTMLEITGITV